MLRFLFLFFFCLHEVYALPSGFIYLSQVDSSIVQEIRYAGKHNFIGRTIKGYQTPQCILTKEAALALAKVQKELQHSGLSLKVYDCYRPTRAVSDFMAWSKDVSQQQMKKEFYPEVNKADFFRLGYVAEQSGHSRGSTVDLTIIPSSSIDSTSHPTKQLSACNAPYLQRQHDNSIDMGTDFDCMDEKSHRLDTTIGLIPFAHRMLLSKLMTHYGFVPYAQEWWHFTLQNEPYKNKYFNFPVT